MTSPDTSMPRHPHPLLTPFVLSLGTFLPGPLTSSISSTATDQHCIVPVERNVRTTTDQKCIAPVERD